jgi:hypothetical protein
MARPFKNPDEVRDNPVVARLTDHEKRLLLAMADEQGVEYSRLAHTLIAKGLRDYMDGLQYQIEQRLKRSGQ